MVEIGNIVALLSKPFRRHTKPGAAPGTIVSRPDAAPARVHVICYGPDNLVEQEVEDLTTLPQFVQRHPITWINVEGVGDGTTIQTLGEIFNLHPLALEDVMHVHQRAKVEDYDGRLFIVARMVHPGDVLETEQVSLFVGPNFVLTFQEGQPGDCFEPVRERLRREIGRLRRAGSDYLAYALIDAVIDGYFPMVETFSERLDVLDEHIVAGRNGDVISQIHKLRSELLLMHRSIWPHREAVNKMLLEAHQLITKETRVFLRDCYDHTVQIIDVLDTYREMCSELRELYFALLNRRTNDVMKMLTIVATIFIPLSFIAGVYGMNFEYMPELQWPHGYALAWGVMGTVAAGLVAYIWRRGWFGT